MKTFNAVRAQYSAVAAILTGAALVRFTWDMAEILAASELGRGV